MTDIDQPTPEITPPELTPEEQARAVAAEYVLGVLSAEDRTLFETRVAQEPAVARDVAFWEERLGGMASFVDPITPPSQIWTRVEAALRTPAGGGVAQPVSLWHNVSFWRAFGLGSALVAASLAAVVVLGIGTSPPVQPRAPLLATLTGIQSNQPNFVAAIGADGRSLTIVPAALLTADKRSMELWLIPQGGKPASLGLIAAGQPVRLNVPSALLDQVGNGATLAVSLEPLGGSPTGQPTGEVIAHGNLTRL